MTKEAKIAETRTWAHSQSRKLTSGTVIFSQYDLLHRVVVVEIK